MVILRWLRLIAIFAFETRRADSLSIARFSGTRIRLQGLGMLGADTSRVPLTDVRGYDAVVLTHHVRRLLALSNQSVLCIALIANGIFCTGARIDDPTMAKPLAITSGHGYWPAGLLTDAFRRSVLQFFCKNSPCTAAQAAIFVFVVFAYNGIVTRMRVRIAPIRPVM